MAELTLEDIADKAGVSRSTVSRVINDHPNVRRVVRERVLEVIHATGYQPNAAAQTLASRRTMSLGFVLPRSVSSLFANPYYPLLTQSIAETCTQRNYALGLYLFSTGEDEEKMTPRLSRRGVVDGVLLKAGQDEDQLVEKLAASGIPLVMIGRPWRVEDISYIDVDNVQAAHSATSHLIRLGRQRIALITGPSSSTAAADRREGFYRALADRNRPLLPELVAESEFTENGGYQAMQKLFFSRPDAVFAASDVMAMGAIRAVQERGKRVPEDVAVVGFDGLPMSMLLRPQLTTIRQPVQAIGASAVELLIELIENGTHPPRKIIMDTQFIIRESCGGASRKTL